MRQRIWLYHELKRMVRAIYAKGLAFRTALDGSFTTSKTHVSKFDTQGSKFNVQTEHDNDAKLIVSHYMLW